jgi:hypothetical protein
MRRAIDALLPDGPVLSPAPGDYLDKLLSGVADNHQATLDDLADLAYIRNPGACPEALLSDLEREHGISPSTALTLSERRAALAVVRFKKKSLRTVARLQAVLDKAGFGSGGYGLLVTPNASPATDPSAIVDDAFELTAHAIGEGMYAGNANAYAAKRGGYYLVNGDQYTLEPVYPQAGQICARAFDGSDSLSGTECAGYYSSYTQYSNEYSSPPKGYWPLIFFIGGVVSRNMNGSIASISTVWIPAHRRQELHRLILRYKPLGMWAAMIVQYS